MRIALPLQRIEARLEQQALLFFKFEFDTQRVPHLERDADHHGRAKPDQDLKSPIASFKREQTARACRAGHVARNPLAADFKGANEEQHQNLAVDARLEQVAPYPTPQAQVDEWSKRPYLVRLNKSPEKAGGQPERGVEWQREVFAVEESRDRQYDATKHRPNRTDKQPEQNRGLKRDVGSLKIRDLRPDPHAKRERNQHECHQAHGLAAAAEFGEQKLLKCA